ncbi:MAG: GtrA family protein [Conexibacter sp.]|nr:GtrA family protein [Conexibacter sp.]
MALSATLRHPLTAQLARYGIAGAITLVLGAIVVLLLSGPGGLAIQLAIPLSYPVIAVVHFSLQRHFVFVGGEYALAGGAQLGRYLLVAVVGHYGCVAGGTAFLHDVAGLGDQLAYLIMVSTMPIVMFVVMRLRVFH